MSKREITPQTPMAQELSRLQRSSTRLAHDPIVQRLLDRSGELLRRRGVHERCSVSIERRGRWFVLRGRVDSHRTRSQLFGMVPKSDGAQWIVDHLRIDTRVTKTDKS